MLLLLSWLLLLIFSWTHLSSSSFNHHSSLLLLAGDSWLLLLFCQRHHRRRPSHWVMTWISTVGILLILIVVGLARLHRLSNAFIITIFVVVLLLLLYVSMISWLVRQGARDWGVVVPCVVHFVCCWYYLCVAIKKWCLGVLGGFCGVVWKKLAVLFGWVLCYCFFE